MSIINNSHAIGVDTRNLVLKTRGTLHVKVGDRYYEIDFRNLNKTPEEKEDLKQESFILSVATKKDIDNLDYPGDNKLIVGEDGSLYVTKNNTFVDITPKQQTIINNNNVNYEEVINTLNTVLIKGFLHGLDGELKIDFANSEIDVNTLRVNNELTFPATSIKNVCGQTIDGIYSYTDKDFLEIFHPLEKISLKSGVMVKSNIDFETEVLIEGNVLKTQFRTGEVCMLYVYNNIIYKTKIN